MTKKDIKEAYELINKLENGRVVNANDFARIMTVATGTIVKPTRCIPCLKSDLKKLRNILSNIDVVVVEEKIVEPTPVLEEIKVAPIVKIKTNINGKKTKK